MATFIDRFSDEIRGKNCDKLSHKFDRIALDQFRREITPDVLYPNRLYLRNGRSPLTYILHLFSCTHEFQKESMRHVWKHV